MNTHIRVEAVFFNRIFYPNTYTAQNIRGILSAKVCVLRQVYNLHTLWGMVIGSEVPNSSAM